MAQFSLLWTYLFGYLLKTVSAHHDQREPWNMHFQYGFFRAFFGGFFSTMLLILGVLVFYHYCVQGGNLGRIFPFPKRSIIPITIPFARAPNYIDSDRPETLVLTSTKNTPSVFYSNAPMSIHAATPTSPWEAAITSTAKIGHSGYDIL